MVLTNSKCSRLVSWLGNILFQISKCTVFLLQGEFYKLPQSKNGRRYNLKQEETQFRYHKNIGLSRITKETKTKTLQFENLKCNYQQ